jgi:hypothetical protein
VKGRTWPLWVVAGVCAVVVGWMSCIVVQHLRVRSLLSELRSDVESYRPPSFRTTARMLDLLGRIKAHGCRALPVIMDEFYPEEPSAYLEGLSTILMNNLYSGLRTPEMNLYPLQVSEGDDPAERRRKCESLRRWWAKEGSRYHQTWRFWSTDCGVR